MSEDLSWEDRILVRAAARLIGQSHPEAAEALLTRVELIVTYGSSWWDGHDDYIYDIEINCRADPSAVPALAIDSVVKAFGKVVHMFRDSSGGQVRGDLVQFQPGVSPVLIDEDRLRLRRVGLAEA